jgi:thiamine-phosphate pyrophosphorylase
VLESFTPGAERALLRAAARAQDRGSGAVEPVDLAAALGDETESRAALLLTEFGVDPAALLHALGLAPWPFGAPEPDAATALPHSSDLRLVIGDASLRARSFDRGRGIGTEHLLGGLLTAPGLVAHRLEAAGLRLAALLEQLDQSALGETAAIPLASEIPPLELADPAEAVDLGRILDASANRAREGLRVVEDYVRFVLDHPTLTRRLKDVRHRLTEATAGLDLDTLIAARDTAGDVGTRIMTASEQARENPRAVLTANFKRTGEALRSLEEYSKLLDPWLAGRFEVLRYDLYTLEKMTLTAVAAHRALEDAHLYVLVGGQTTLGDLTWVVGEALAGGAQVIQLREKGLPDREILLRARAVRSLTIQAHAHFIMNDRTDLAVVAGADGVHLGQDDLGARDARRIVGARMLLGISTHSVDQIERAILEGAGYLGVGPVFPSETKAFPELAGLAFVRQAAALTSLPWFALGGITEETIESVLEAGARRVAVSAAVTRAERPRAAAQALRARLDAALAR